MRVVTAVKVWFILLVMLAQQVVVGSAKNGTKIAPRRAKKGLLAQQAVVGDVKSDAIIAPRIAAKKVVVVGGVKNDTKIAPRIAAKKVVAVGGVKNDTKIAPRIATKKVVVVGGVKNDTKITPRIAAKKVVVVGGVKNDTILAPRIAAMLSDFHWKGYIELNPDLARVINNEKDALKHFKKSGIREGRPFRVLPNKHSFTRTVETIKISLKKFKEKGIDISKRNLVVYHIGKTNVNNSMDVFVNNLKFFTSAMVNHNSAMTKSPTKVQQQAVYLFNVVGGQDNPLFSLIPKAPNVGIVEWERASSDMMTHIRTIEMIGKNIVNKFSALVFLNQGVRGPMVLRSNGDWLTEYRRLLDSNGVAMVGSTISCEKTPHIQTHVFAMSPSNFTNIIAVLDNGPRKSTTWSGIIAQFEVGLSTALLNGGHRISAVLYDRRMKTPYFNKKCIQPPGKAPNQQNPSSWCDVTPRETIFMKWGGEPLRTNGYICDRTIDMMSRELEKLAVAEPSMGLVVPETLIGGRLYDLYKEYTQEMWVNRLDSVLKINLTVPGKSAMAYGSRSGLSVKTAAAVAAMGRRRLTQKKAWKAEKVCFLVRTHGTSEAVTQSTFINSGLPEFIYSLLKQTSANWVATFFNTESNKEYDAELQQFLKRRNDDRLQYLAVPSHVKRQLHSLETGDYTVTDYALSQFSARSDCRWVSVTNEENVYGSQVVERVLGVQNVGYGAQSAPPDMILNPLDSRNFADQDYEVRNYQNHWNRHCLGIEAMLHFNRMAYVAQPIPAVGKVDLASLFLSREKFLATGVYFSNFTDPHKYPCAGCQDGYLTEFLVRNRLWTYTRLPIDGLKSIVFHGPSPTLCMASGNVWFDHPRVSRTGCLSHKTARKLIEDPAQQSLYDWKHFNLRDRLCLRFNQQGFDQSAEEHIEL